MTHRLQALRLLATPAIEKDTDTSSIAAVGELHNVPSSSSLAHQPLVLTCLVVQANTLLGHRNLDMLRCKRAWLDYGAEIKDSINELGDGHADVPARIDRLADALANFERFVPGVPDGTSSSLGDAIVADIMAVFKDTNKPDAFKDTAEESDILCKFMRPLQSAQRANMPPEAECGCDDRNHFGPHRRVEQDI